MSTAEPAPPTPLGGDPAEDPTVTPEQAALARATRRWVVAGLGVVALIGLALGVTWFANGTWNPAWESAPRGTVCPAQQLTPSDPDDVRVNVYNATQTEGKASMAARALKKRGFKVGRVTNSELSDQRRSQAGLILSGPGTLQQALAVQRQVPGVDVLVQPARTDGTVDLVLGEGFRRLLPPAKVSHSPGQLRCTSSVMGG